MLWLETHGIDPFQSVKDLLLFPVLRLVNNLGFFRDICHPLLQEECANDVSGQVIHGLLIIRLDSWSAENAKSRITPFHGMSTRSSVVLPLERSILKTLCRKISSRCFSSNSGATRNKSRKIIQRLLFAQATAILLPGPSINTPGNEQPHDKNMQHRKQPRQTIKRQNY